MICSFKLVVWSTVFCYKAKGILIFYLGSTDHTITKKFRLIFSFFFSCPFSLRLIFQWVSTPWFSTYSAIHPRICQIFHTVVQGSSYSNVSCEGPSSHGAVSLGKLSETTESCRHHYWQMEPHLPNDLGAEKVLHEVKGFLTQAMTFWFRKHQRGSQ